MECAEVAPIKQKQISANYNSSNNTVHKFRQNSGTFQPRLSSFSSANSYSMINQTSGRTFEMRSQRSVYPFPLNRSSSGLTS